VVTKRGRGASVYDSRCRRQSQDQERLYIMINRPPFN
jgi:hypothetical protein